MDITQQSEIIHPAVQDISLTAVLPQEMVAAQTQLIAWCENKIAVERADVDELRLATDHAKSHKWKSATLESQWKKALKRLEYYVKIKIALEPDITLFRISPLKCSLFASSMDGDPKDTAPDIGNSISRNRRSFRLAKEIIEILSLSSLDQARLCRMERL